MKRFYVSMLWEGVLTLGRRIGVLAGSVMFATLASDPAWAQRESDGFSSPPQSVQGCQSMDGACPIPFFPCCDSLVCIGFTCQVPRKAGEACAFSSDCQDGLDCRACFVDGCNSAFECFPQTGHELFPEDLCLSFYSADVHQAAIDGNVTLSFGAGSSAAVVVSASDEIGVVYGQDGRYGCFLTTCIGANTEVSISDSVCVGFYNSYDDFRGTSSAIVEEASLPLELLSFSTSQIFGGPLPPSGPLIGTEDCLSLGIGLDLFPVSAGLYQCNTTVDTVIPSNDPPVAVCSDVTTCADDFTCTADPSVDGGSFDPDGDPITRNQSPSGPYGLGVHLVTLTVTDPDGESDSCVAVVTVNDCTPPVVSCEVARATLWPPNHKMIDVGFVFSATDACDPDPTIEVTTSSDENPAQARGAGGAHHCPDAVIGADQSVQLRAERAGGDDGRVYVVTVAATDASGNGSHCESAVTVPKRRRRTGVDSGQVFDATLCGSAGGQRGRKNRGR